MIKIITVSELYTQVRNHVRTHFQKRLQNVQDVHKRFKSRFTLLSKDNPNYTTLLLSTLGSGVLSRQATKVKGLTTTLFNSCLSTLIIRLEYARLAITHFPEFLHCRYLRFRYMVIHKYVYFIYYRFLLFYIPLSKSFKQKFDKSKFRLFYKK